MRTLKLQMQVTVDGFAAGPRGELDWMTRTMDGQVIAFINELTDSSDAILMGRKMTPGFVHYWESVITKPDSPEYQFGQKMVNLPKVVFSKTVDHLDGKNVHVERGDLVETVTGLKRQPGKDMIVYGGVTFVASLIDHDLIDEMNLFVNPVAIGNGLRPFHVRKPLTLARSTPYPSGIVVNTYRLKASA